MSMLRTVCRGLLSLSVVSLALGGCSISFGGAPSAAPSAWASGPGRPIYSNDAPRPIDDREKPLPGATKRPIPKAEAPQRDRPSADPAPQRDRPTQPAPKRTKPAPKRSKPAPTREPASTREPAPTREPASTREPVAPTTKDRAPAPRRVVSPRTASVTRPARTLGR